VPLSNVKVRLTGDIETAEQNTNPAGLATFRWRLLGVAGEQRVVAQANLRSNPAVEFRANAVPGATAQLIRVKGTDNVVGFVASEVDTIAVATRDRFGNATAVGTVVWSVTAGGGSVRPAGIRPPARHAAVWTLGPEAGENTVVASVGDVRLTFSATAITDAFAPRQISAGGDFSCALSAANVAYCWGHNEWGQLGVITGDTVSKRPVKVQTDLLFSSLVSGVFHTCGLTASGEAHCWGANWAGQLGFMGETSSPRRVTGVPALKQLAAGAHHTCGLTTVGVVYCWGDNAYGQIGSGSVRASAALPSTYAWPDPVAVSGGRRYVAIAASWDAACAIAETGDVYCWGGFVRRQLSQGVLETCRIAGSYEDPADYDAPCSTVPVRLDVPSQVKFRSLVHYALDWCGISTADQLWCWGADITSPRVTAPRPVREAWLVEHIVCVVEMDGTTISCWGGFYGPVLEHRPPFGNDLSLGNLSSIGSHSCGISRDSRRAAFCWGTNYRGQLGDGTTTYRHSPTRVLPPTK
jgi:hypothetical protein